MILAEMNVLAPMPCHTKPALLPCLAFASLFLPHSCLCKFLVVRLFVCLFVFVGMKQRLLLLVYQAAFCLACSWMCVTLFLPIMGLLILSLAVWFFGRDACVAGSSLFGVPLHLSSPSRCHALVGAALAPTRACSLGNNLSSMSLTVPAQPALVLPVLAVVTP